MTQQNPKLKVITHYSKDDPKMIGDYTGVEIFKEETNGMFTLLKRYGDYYHDKGLERAAGFLQGYSAALGDCDVSVEGMADTDEGGDWF